MRKAVILIACAMLSVTSSGPSFADIPVIDDDILEKQKDDEAHSGKDVETQTDQLEGQTVTNCNISQKEKNRRLYRSPAKAVEEDARNVELIKHYAEKHNVPVGLALAVAHAESGISTCSGSPTGVKGVMQLTKKTGRGMGFDRDINEENIEGGVKYLGMGVNKCGATDYGCLASWYNGSTAAEQRNWSGKVGRNHTWFNAYAGGSSIETIASPGFKSHVDYGSAGTRKANQAASDVVDRAISGIDRNAARMREAERRITGMGNLVGSSEIYQDAWDDNSSARALNSELLNNLVSARNLINELMQARIQLGSSKASETVKTLKADDPINPYSCDPVLLQKTGVPVNKWPDCASSAAGTEEAEFFSRTDSNTAIADHLLSIQDDSQTNIGGEFP